MVVLATTAVAAGLTAAAAPLCAQSVSVWQHYLCAADGTGGTYCWGSVPWRPRFPGLAGQPVVRLDSTVIRLTTVEVGWLHACGLTAEGVVYCGGANHWGQLGRPIDDPCTQGRCIAMAPVASDVRFRAVTTGGSHSCALAVDDRAYCWGLNDAGQTGVGSRADSLDSPTPVVGDHRFIQLAAGDRHTCGITESGEVLCWGANNWGQLGWNQRRHECELTAACMATPTPMDVRHPFASIAGGTSKMCGITRSGDLYCWGRAYTTVADTLPVVPQRIGAGEPFIAVAPGYWFTCGSVGEGRTYCWREIRWAAVGDDPRRGAACDDAPLCVPARPISDSLFFRHLGAGEATACGVSTTSALYCWGLRDPALLATLDPPPQCSDPVRGPELCSQSPVRFWGDLTPGSGPATTRLYAVRPGDSLRLIALRFCGDESQFTRIVRANESVVMNPDHILVGWLLRIPECLPRV